MNKEIDISTLIGKTFTSIKGAESGSDEIVFIDSEKNQYKMYHNQDCCERVSVEDIIGDINDLLNTPILTAYEETSNENPLDIENSFTWTFYRISTIKGSVTIRWYGESNGYYSESVNMIQFSPE
jgi:hypothetical protein